MTLLNALELIIKPSNSKSYCRLMMVLYLLTFFLILQASIAWWMQLGFLVCIGFCVKKNGLQKRPSPEVLAIHAHSKHWYIEYVDGNTVQFESMRIVIHNPLFQCIQFVYPKKESIWDIFKQNYYLILFNDQLPEEQLRHLHLLSQVNSV